MNERTFHYLIIFIAFLNTRFYALTEQISLIKIFLGVYPVSRLIDDSKGCVSIFCARYIDCEENKNVVVIFFLNFSLINFLHPLRYTKKIKALF